MPNFEEHCESTLKKLGCRFERIHKWIDSPSQYMGKGHRARRHDPYQTPEIAKELFSKHYPNYAHLIEEGVLNHIELDREGETEREERKWEESLSELRAYYWKNKREVEEAKRKYTFEQNPIGMFILSLVLFPFLAVISCIVLIGLIPIFVFLFAFSLFIKNLFLLYYLTFWFAGLTIFMFWNPLVPDEFKPSSSLEIEKPQEKYVKEKEESDFLTEENLEAQGIPSSAVMDMEDSENEEF